MTAEPTKPFTAANQREAAIREEIEKARRAFDEKTARLRALRLAKEVEALAAKEAADSEKAAKRQKTGKRKPKRSESPEI